MTQPSHAPNGVTIRLERPEDEAAVIRLWHLRSPDLPKTTIEEYRGFIATVPEGIPWHRLVAEHNGEVIATGNALTKFWVANSGSTVITVFVRPEQRNRGVGGAMYSALEIAAREFGSERLFTDVRENQPDGLRFAQERGFEPTDHVVRLSRLEVSAAQYDGYDGLEERLRGQGITVKTLAQLGADDEDVLREWHHIEIETAKDEPTSEAFNISFEVWRDSVMKMPGVSPDATFAALHGGRIVGVTKVQREGEDAGWHAGMGVLREFRGQGVARLLKWHSIQWARNNGLAYLYTGNDKQNPRMYSINQRLGYVPLPGTMELVRTI